MPETTPNTIPDVTAPSAYKKFGTTRGFHPKPFESLRWLIGAQGGWGKSTFLSSIPNMLHLDIEGGAHSVVNSEAIRIPDHSGGLSYDTLGAVLNQLILDGEAAKGNPSRLPFTAIGIDTIDAMYNMFGGHFCRKGNPAGQELDSVGEYGSDGAGYGIIYARILTVLATLESLGYALVIGYHERETTIKKKVHGKIETLTKVRPLLGESISKQLENRSDVNAVLRPKVKMVVLPGKTVNIPGVGTKALPGEKTTTNVIVMQVECSPVYSAKRRLHTFKGEFELPLQHGWSYIKTIYDKAVVDMQKMLESGGPIPASS